MKYFKKVVILLIALLLVPNISKSQSVEDVFESNEVVWFGLDFSNAKMVGPEGFRDPDEVVRRFFRSWNSLVPNESNKYDIKKFFRKENVEYDLSVVTKRNSDVDPDELVIESFETHEISKETIQSIISEYETEKSGLGLVFIIETFNKTEDIGTMYVTFFDIDTKKVLLSKKMSGESGGFGLRNYWARSYYNVMMDCEDEYLKWKEEYISKE